jgi:hypothetical protein
MLKNIGEEFKEESRSEVRKRKRVKTRNIPIEKTVPESMESTDKIDDQAKDPKTQLTPPEGEKPLQATESLATAKKKKRHIYEGIFKYHDLFGVFFTFDKELSRPARFALYYLRINLMITLSAVFCQSLD